MLDTNERDRAVLDRQADAPADESLGGVAFDEYFELNHAASWIKSQGFQRLCFFTVVNEIRPVGVIARIQLNQVALQFPDELLWSAPRVSAWLQRETSARVFVLGDSSYSPCCIDEVAAEHASADALIHVGQTCLSPNSRLPVLYIFGRTAFDADDFLHCLSTTFDNKEEKVVLFYDTRLHYALDKLARAKDHYPHLLFPSIPSYFDPRTPTSVTEQSATPTCNILSRSYSIQMDQLQECSLLWVGEECLTLTNLFIQHHKSKIVTYVPSQRRMRVESPNVNRTLMRRHYLVEAAKDASVFGILVGTLAVANFLAAIEQLKDIIRKAHKKYYTFVVGKVNVAKLANFPEIDMFITVACPLNSLIDSREFYKPIITPVELEMALVEGKGWSGDYSTDFQTILSGEKSEPPLESSDYEKEVRYSLISQSLRPAIPSQDAPPEASSSTALSIVDNKGGAVSTLHHENAASFLATRTYQGLNPEIGDTPVSLAVKGRSGIAIEYESEMTDEQSSK